MVHDTTKEKNDIRYILRVEQLCLYAHTREKCYTFNI